jgi:hypothetical protein
VQPNLARYSTKLVRYSTSLAARYTPKFARSNFTKYATNFPIYANATNASIFKEVAGSRKGDSFIYKCQVRNRSVFLAICQYCATTAAFVA